MRRSPRRQCPGTFSVDHELLVSLLRATLDEIGRNGFTKIVLVNYHGGNTALLGYLLLGMLQHRKPYVVYATNNGPADEDRGQWNRMFPSSADHAGPIETSLILHLRPETVHMEALRDPSDGAPRGHLKRLGGVKNSFSWYADHPTHLKGDPRSASAEKGALALEMIAKHVARQVKAIKEDDVSAALAKEFYDAGEHPQAPPQ